MCISVCVKVNKSVKEGKKRTHYGNSKGESIMTAITIAHPCCVVTADIHLANLLRQVTAHTPFMRTTLIVMAPASSLLTALVSYHIDAHVLTVVHRAPRPCGLSGGGGSQCTTNTTTITTTLWPEWWWWFTVHHHHDPVD